MMQDFNNPIFICSTAKDFLEKSSVGAKEIYFNAEILDVNTEGQLQSLGKLPFPMVTAAFSMELALKGLLMQHKIQIPNKHDLKNLFSLLPNDVQSNIIEHYQLHDKFYGYPNLYIKIGSMNNPMPPSVLPKKDNNTIKKHVDELLERHKNAFIDFRYLHEFGINKDELAMDYNYFANFTYSIISILAITVGFPIATK
ncbi:MAG TPA: HEPN domain-containing protein [Chitinophagaceae bacterium]